MFPEFLLDIPFSTIFIFLLAAAISFLTSLANRLLTDPEKTKAQRKEIAEWNRELREAQRSKDKKRTEKLMKKQQYILRLQSKMMWQSMKVMLLFIVPLFLIWQFLGRVYTSPEGLIAIAYFPGVGPVLPLLNMSSLFWWYLLCSFLFGTIFSHLFGLVIVE
jgi:uncharacterized membrane protein (DUF106 family)